LSFSEVWGPFKKTETLWGDQAAVKDGIITLTAGERNVTVLKLT
jgi:hypothetical protein